MSITYAGHLQEILNAHHSHERPPVLEVISMNALTAWALTSLVANGAPILLFTAFIGSLGIPFPISIVIVAAGAFTHAGLLDWRLALLACLTGAALADNSEYILGRFAHTWLKQRFDQKAAWQQAQSTINRQGGWAILLTRFWLTPLAPAINVIAGASYPYLRFLLLDITGQLLWVVLYGGLGYLFAAQWQLVSRAINAFSGLSFALFFLTLGVYILVLRRKTPRGNSEPDGK
jgi:membrane-associated protein